MISDDGQHNHQMSRTCLTPVLFFLLAKEFWGCCGSKHVAPLLSTGLCSAGEAILMGADKKVQAASWLEWTLPSHGIGLKFYKWDQIQKWNFWSVLETAVSLVQAFCLSIFFFPQRWGSSFSWNFLHHYRIFSRCLFETGIMFDGKLSISGSRQCSSKISQMCVKCGCLGKGEGSVAVWASFHFTWEVWVFLRNSGNQATWDSDFFICLCSVILVNNAKGKVNPSDSQTAVCIVATHTPALQSKWIHLFVRHLLLNPEGEKRFWDHSVEWHDMQSENSRVENTA